MFRNNLARFLLLALVGLNALSCSAAEGEADFPVVPSSKNVPQMKVETVAENRGVSVETVLDKFGQGDVLVGKDAVSAGLADEIGNFETALQIVSGQKQIGEKPKMENKMKI